MSRPEPQALEPLLNPGETLKRLPADKSMARYAWKMHQYRSVILRKLKERGVSDDFEFHGLQAVPCEGPGCSVWIEFGQEVIVVSRERDPKKKKYLFCSIPCQRRHHVDHSSSRVFQGSSSRKLRGEDLDAIEFEEPEK